MNIRFKTLGCKVNQYETQAMKEALINLGHKSTNAFPSDVIIINSCTVTAESDKKTRQLLHRTRKENPQAVIVLTGCMVQAFPEKVKMLPEADIIIGNKDSNAVIKAINEYNDKRVFCVDKHDINDTFSGLSISGFSERTRAFMKIEDGCNRCCSYCIIPKARGFVRSRTLESIKAEAENLAQNGYVEIVLVGINLSAYGLDTEFDICDAVDTVCNIKGIKRVRLGSLEPDHITDKMLKRLSLQEKFCPQFHLSLQSGCNETLKRMNRHYDTAFYLDLVNRIRRVFKNPAITTDIMVGFAGETDKEFLISAEFVKKVRFARSHIFPYSRRAGTVADRLPDQIQSSVKKERAKKMSNIAKDCEREFLEEQIGSIQSVLFESAKDGKNEGYTPNYTRVCIECEKNFEGQIRDVKITESFEDYVKGEII